MDVLVTARKLVCVSAQSVNTRRNKMGKLCARGKAAAKRKFKVYPSAYANMYASAVCSGKVTPGGKKKVKKKANGGSISQQRSAAEAAYRGRRPVRAAATLLTSSSHQPCATRHGIPLLCSSRGGASQRLLSPA